ncbi:MAG: PaaI family thioesterase [Terracidiphilus sp.]
MNEPHEPATPLAHSANNHCFGCGPANSTGLRLEFFLAPDGSVVSMPVVPGAFDGHPGYLHGGIIATLLDEAMSKAVRAQGHPSVTRKLEVEYLRPVPSGAELRIEAHVVRSDHRKHWTEASIVNAEGVVLAHGKGLFFETRLGKTIGGGPKTAP